MKRLTSFILFIFFAYGLNAQKTAKHIVKKPVVNEFAAIDKLALQIPDSSTNSTKGISNYINLTFKTEAEKVRAIFVWIATNIQYDYENLYTIDFRKTLEDKINTPLKTRKGICENYASLFTDLCQKCGIKAYVVTGYTKQNGVIDRIAHAWCAALINNSWALYDPTWGSDVIKINKATGYTNNLYFNVSPALLIESHMPYDYLWQFLHYPVDRQSFALGNTAEDKTKPLFSYADSIQAYERFDSTTKLISTASRLERNGKMNNLVFAEYENIRIQLENKKQNDVTSTCNAANASNNQAISSLNEFINYRNHQFKPSKPDADIQDMLYSIKKNIYTAKTTLATVKNPDANTSQYITQLTKSISDVERRLNEEQDWLTKYLGKGKLLRRLMF